MTFYNSVCGNDEILADRNVMDCAYAGSLQDYNQCRYEDAFGVSKVRFCNGQCSTGVVATKMGTSALTGYLGIKARNLFISLFSSVMEKRFLSQFGGNYHAYLDETRTRAIPTNVFPYTFGDPSVLTEGFYAPRRNMVRGGRLDGRNMVYDAVLGLWQEYRTAQTKARTFGSVFPDCPYDGCKPTWPEENGTEPKSWRDLLDLAVSCVYGTRNYDVKGLFRDITMRVSMCHRFNSEGTEIGCHDIARQILRSCGRFSCFWRADSDHATSGWAPFLRYYAELVKSVYDGGSELCHYVCAMTRWRDDSGSVRDLCMLKRHGEDYLYCWARGPEELKDCGYIKGVHYCRYPEYNSCYNKIFRVNDGISGSSATLVNWLGNGYNPFAVSLALAVLASFQKYQAVKPCLSMGSIAHKIDTVTYEVRASEDSSGNVLLVKSKTCVPGTVSHVRHTRWAFTACKRGEMKANTTDRLWFKPHLMYRLQPSERTGSMTDYVYIYYWCNGWDCPYRNISLYCGSSEKQPMWPACRCHYVWYDQCNPAAIVRATREFPCNKGQVASETNNFIHLSTPTEIFPDTAGAVRNRTVSFDLRQVLHADFGYDRGSSYADCRRPSFRMVGRCRAPGGFGSDWVPEAAFGMFNEGPWNCQCAALRCLLRNQGLCSFSDVCTNWTDKYFGFDGGRIDGINNNATYWCDKLGHRHYWSGDPKPYYQSIHYSEVEGAWTWLGVRYSDGQPERLFPKYHPVTPPTPDPGGSEWVIISDWSRAILYVPYQDGCAGYPFGQHVAETNVVFGGYFEVIEWDFKTLRRV